MKKLKRTLAIFGVIFLVSLYLLTLISAITASKHSNALFQASLFSTFIIPVFLYALGLVYRLLKKDSSNNTDNHENQKK